MSVKAPEHGRPLDVVHLGAPEAEEVLVEAEIPVVYTLRSGFGERLLAYVADETATTRWVVLAPCSDAALETLKGGHRALRDVLTGSWMWLAALRPGQGWEAGWAITEDDLPVGHLPLPGTTLFAGADDVLAIRAVGEHIGRATTPASVVAYVADATRKALKGVLEFVQERAGTGRPPDELRALYDLPVQNFAFHSFEIVFAAPPLAAPDATLDRAIELLRRGLTWAAGTGDDPFTATSDDERRAVLKAVGELTPPGTGGIEAIEVKGLWMASAPVHLARSARRRVQGELRKLKSERTVSLTGKIRELDKDNLSFTLRNPPTRADVRAVFADELFDDVLDFFNNDDLVLAVGVERAGKVHVAVVGRAPVEADVGGVVPLL